MTEQKESPKNSDVREPKANPAMITVHDENYKPSNQQKGQKLF